MKKLIVLISVFSLGFGFYAKAQYIGAQDLPADVNQDFSAKYPNLSKVDWEKNGKQFKATFSVEKWAHEIVYDQNGKVVSQQFGLPLTSVPADVFGGVKKNFPELEVKEADQIVEKGKVSYKLSLKDENNAVAKVIMAPDGRVIRTVTEDQQ